MAVAENAKPRHPASMVYLARLPFGVYRCAESFEGREKFLTHCRHNVAHMRTVPTGNQPAVAGHEIHKPTKGQLDRLKIGIDVRVIEFDVVDDGEFGQVVHELGPLIEVSGVIFVAFDNEVIALRYPKAGAKVLYDSAD